VGPAAPPKRNAHVPALDGVRGAAILGVLLLHATSRLAAPELAGPALALKRVFGLGWTGVDLFFVLSGFLITGILADARESPRYFRSFYLRRALRILPLYYGFLLVLFTLAAAWHERVPPGGQLWYWLHLQNFHSPSGPPLEFGAHLWSLAVEEQFYLVWPAAMFVLSRRGAVRTCVACLGLTLAFRLAAWRMGVDLHHLYFWTPARLDGLAVGALLALLARGEGGLERFRRPAAAAAAFALAALACAPATASGFDPGGVYMISVGYSALAVLFGALLLAVVASPRGVCARVAEWAPLRFFGRYSYAIYVLHVPVLVLAARAGLSPSGVLPGAPGLVRAAAYVALMVAASVAAALVSWHLLERPFLSLKRHIPYR
jgi:peptidoglycan/LPS O-acetylase OafA/YrhL